MMLTGKDSFWLQLEVCREFQRSRCTRADVECKFAHPPTNVEVQANGRVTACYDSIKGRCQRESCKYMHPPAHLKDQLLINGRNHLALKNALLFQQQQQQQQQQQHHRQLISNFPSLQHQADLSLLAKHPQQHPGHLSHHQQQHQQQQHAALLQSAMALAAASTAGRQASSSPFGLPSHPSQPNHSSPAMRPTAAFDLSMTNPTAAALAAALAATSSMSPFLAPAGPHFGPPTYAGQYAAAAAMAAAAAAAATQQHPHAHLRHPQPAQTANKTPNGPPSSQGRDSERTPEGSSALMAPPGKQQEPAASSPVQTSPSTGGRPDADQLAAFYGLSPAVLAAAASATAALLGGAQPTPTSLGMVPATTSVSTPNHSATHQSNGQSRASPKEQTKANGIAVHEGKHKSSDASGAAGEAIDRCDKKRLLNGSSKGDQTFEGPDGTRESKRLRSEGDKQADDGRPSEPERQQTNCDSQSSDCNGLDAGTDTDAGHLEDSKEASKVRVECKSSNNHVDSNGQSKERQKQPGSPVEPKLEICREFLRNSCKRSQSECRFAHPPRHLINHNSRPLSAAGCLINDSFGAYVTVCRDYLRGRCTREDSKCRFLHPEAHLQTRLDFKRHRGGAKLSH